MLTPVTITLMMSEGSRAELGGLRQWRNGIKEGPAGQSARDRTEVRSGLPSQRVISK